ALLTSAGAIDRCPCLATRVVPRPVPQTVGMVTNFCWAINGVATNRESPVAPPPQLALGEAHGDAAHLEAPGLERDRLLAGGQPDGHRCREIRAFDRQDEAAARIAARNLAAGRVDLLLPRAVDLRAPDAELGRAVDAVVGAGAAQGLPDLGAALADLVPDGALDLLFAFAEHDGAAAGPVAVEVLDRTRRRCGRRQRHGKAGCCCSFSHWHPPNLTCASCRIALGSAKVFRRWRGGVSQTLRLRRQ